MPDATSVERFERAAAFGDESLDEDDVFVEQPLALILPPQHPAQLDEILEQRRIVIRPLLVAFHFDLDAPLLAEFLRANIAALTVGSFGSPFVDIAGLGRFRWHDGDIWQESARLKELAKLLLYFAGVIALGAVLAPPLYWAGQALAARGVLTFLAETDFQKFFNRAMLVAAVGLLWPTLRWLRLDGVRGLGLERDPRWRQRFAIGFAISALCVALLAAAYIAGGVYRWKGTLPWGKIPPLLLSALVVALIEEGLFRGGILGLFRRSMKPGAAIVWTSAIFSAVHFLKPDDDVQVGAVTWLSGFALIPHVFHQFAEPLLVLGGFTTIFVLGLMLADVTVRTRSLWMAIGLHAGVVFVKMSFSKLTKREEAYLPWIGEELQIGLVPVVALLLGWWGARLWLKHADAAPRG